MRGMKMRHTLREHLNIWWNVLKDLPNRTSLHGFRFIADSNRHWSERLFWLLFVALSWYGSSLLIAAQYEAFQNNPISFVVETTYKDWDTHFPSVAICESDNTRRIEIVSDMLWGEEHDFNLEEVLKELAYFKGITYYTSQFCASEDRLPDCIKDNLTLYSTLVRSTCEETLSDCTWNGNTFKCCEYFKPMDTELGTCYAINSIQGRDANAPKLLMVSNKVTRPGSIRFKVAVPANIYILNEEEVPSLTTLGTDIITVIPEVYSSDTGFIFGELRRDITIRNIENDAAARHIKPVKRKCRYTDENELNVYRHYSYSACTVQCRKEAQLRFCNCTNFFMPNVSEHLKCDVAGLICLNNHLNDLSVLKASWANRQGLYCDCLPSCTEAEISVVKDFKASTGEEFATIKISLSVLPSERYRRNVVRGVLDLVVSMGGTGGLFIGASILSFAELIYIIFFRSLCDGFAARASDFSDYWHEKFGNRKLETSNFQANPAWKYEDRGLTRRIVHSKRHSDSY